MEMIIKDIVEPLAHRVGTYIGTFLITIGATQPQVDQVIVGIGALGAIGAELIWRKARRSWYR